MPAASAQTHCAFRRHEESAKYIELFKQYEKKPADMIKQSTATDYLAQVRVRLKWGGGVADVRD